MTRDIKMDTNDTREFTGVIHAIAENYNRQRLGQQTLAIWFNGLKEYPLDQVKKAVADHVLDADQGRFFPTVAHIIAQIGVKAELDASSLLAEARMRSTPLGMRVLSKIQTHDLQSKNEFELRDQASRLLTVVDGWRDKHLAGNYTDGEVQAMVSRGIMPYSPFSAGEQAPPHNKHLHEQVKRFSNDESTKKIATDHPTGTTGEWCDENNTKARGKTPMPQNVRDALSGLVGRVSV